MNFGYPCSALVNLACEYYIRSEPLICDENHAQDMRTIKTPLTFLENKGYLISKEIDKKRVAIWPNTRVCRGEESKTFCWCKRGL